MPGVIYRKEAVRGGLIRFIIYRPVIYRRSEYLPDFYFSPPLPRISSNFILKEI